MEKSPRKPFSLPRAGLAASVAAVAALLASPAAQAAGDAGADSHSFMSLFPVFVLAIFVGYYVVWSVTPALHTPLMSVTNAISSVIIVGALLAVAVDPKDVDGTFGLIAAKFFAFFALGMAAVNIFGGFLVTQRMLAMYKKKDKK